MWVYGNGWSARIEITHYTPVRPAFVSGLPENCYPEEGGELEFHVNEVVYDYGNAPSDEAIEEAIRKDLEEAKADDWW